MADKTGRALRTPGKGIKHGSVCATRGIGRWWKFRNRAGLGPLLDFPDQPGDTPTGQLAWLREFAIAHQALNRRRCKGDHGSNGFELKV